MHTNALETSSKQEIHVANASSNRMEYSHSHSHGIFGCLVVGCLGVWLFECLFVCLFGRLSVWLIDCLTVWPVGRLAVLEASEQLNASGYPHKFYDHVWLSHDSKLHCPSVRFVAIWPQVRVLWSLTVGGV